MTGFEPHVARADLDLFFLVMYVLCGVHLGRTWASQGQGAPVRKYDGEKEVTVVGPDPGSHEIGSRSFY